MDIRSFNIAMLDAKLKAIQAVAKFKKEVSSGPQKTQNNGIGQRPNN